MSIPFRKIYCPAVTSSASSPSPHFTWNMLDDCIMQSFETITKIGGYIIIFSVFLQFGKELPFTHPLLTFLFLPSLEITNGIALICNSGVPTDLAFVLATGLASFGGWCSVAQTYSMIRGSGLSIGDYIAKKLIITGITSLLAYIYIFCFLKQDLYYILFYTEIIPCIQHSLPLHRPVLLLPESLPPLRRPVLLEPYSDPELLILDDCYVRGHNTPAEN